MIFRNRLSVIMAVVPRPSSVDRSRGSLYDRPSTANNGPRTILMPWLIGIDEAGYGPNLGPLVQTAVGAAAPDDGCLWERLAAAVRKFGKKSKDDRLTIDDSKKVYG